MKTLELLSTPEALLAPKLKGLKIKELERHAQKLLERKGNANYREVMSAVIKAVPRLEGEGSERFEAVQEIVRDCLLQSDMSVTEKSDLVERVAVILMVIIARKFDRIHKGKSGVS